MKTKVMLTFTAAALLMTSQLAYARATIASSASVAYLLAQAAVQPVSASNAINGLVEVNTTFQDAPLFSNGGQYKIIGQSDGKLVIYDITLSGGIPFYGADAGVSCQPSNAPGNTAYPNGTLQDTPLLSCDGKYKLIGQSDGNLVIYNITPSGESPIWASNTNNGAGSYNFIFQDEGNLVIYNSNKAIWASNSNGKGGNRLVMQNDGSLVIYAPSGPVWASNSVQSDVPNFSGF